MTLSAFKNADSRSAPRNWRAKLADLKIGAKISLGFGSVLAVMAIMSAVAFLGVANINSGFEKVHQRSQIVRTVRNIERDFLNMRRNVREYADTGGERALTDAHKYQKLAAESIDGAIAGTSEPDLAAMYKTIERNFSAYSSGLDKLVAARSELERQFHDVLNTAGPKMYAEANALESFVATDGNSQHLLQASNAVNQVMMVRFLVNKYFGQHDADAIDAGHKAFADTRAALAALDTAAANADVRQKIDAVAAAASQYEQAFDVAVKADHDTNELASQTMAGLAVNIAKAVAEVVETQTAKETRIQAETAALIARVELVTLALAVAGLVIGSLLAWLIGRAIANPVKEITQSMTCIAGGDVAADIPGRDRSDEIGEMAQAVVVFQQAGRDKIRRDQELEIERKHNEEERRRAQADAIEEERSAVAHSIGAAMAKLAAKDLSYRLNEDLPEAYRQLQADLNEALQEIEAAMRGVLQRSDLIGSSTREISTAADDLSKRTEQQAASLEETAAALEEITATVNKTAEGATNAATIVASTKSEAEKSSDIVMQAIDAMSKIEKSSQEINQIIGVIDEIAFQTNLLALNAGVEAARAGEAGRGFAVVASEVRALAQRSAQAAKEIKSLILSSTGYVSRGVDLVGQTGKALQRIVEGIAEVNRVAVEIASGAQEQATSLREINSAVSQMDQVTQRNAAMVEETTAASRSLRQETDELLRTVADFHVGQQGGAAIHAASVAPVAPPAAAAHRPASPTARPKLKAIGGGGAAARKVEHDVQNEWEEF